MPDQWYDKIFGLDHTHFDEVCVEIFHFQYHQNKIYRAYADMLKIDARKIKSASQIPFLPIQFFKTHKVTTTNFDPQRVFESSGTSQAATSHHLVKDIELYKQSFIKGFEFFYGPVNEWCIIALLPSYLERNNSSLIFMVDELIHRTQHLQSGFYLYEHEKLYATLERLENEKQKTLFLGVSFALLDFAEQYALPLKHTIIMETGGMKGRRQEIIRDELHDLLKARFQVGAVNSEYGMTELLSQAYSKKDGLFQTPPWMKILIRDEEDPLNVAMVQSLESGVRNSQSGAESSKLEVQNLESAVHSPELEATSVKSKRPSPIVAIGTPYKTGAINIIDLANVYSCSFLATDDAGKLYANGTFEVLGRIDNSDVRGCSLMMM